MDNDWCYSHDLGHLHRPWRYGLMRSLVTSIVLKFLTQWQALSSGCENRRYPKIKIKKGSAMLSGEHDIV